MRTLLLLYISSGTLLALLSLPLMAGKIKPNPFYGFRTPQTLGNPNIWYAVNKYFAKLQLFVALIIIAAAIGLSFIPNISVDVYALSVLGIFIFAFSVAFFKGWQYMKSIQNV